MSIDKLTPEQEAKIPEYLERFKNIGLSTRPTDRAKAEAAIRRSYEYMAKQSSNFSKTPEFVWAESPMKGAILAAQFAKGSKDVTPSEIKDQASQASYGSFEAYWVSTYAFIAEQLPVQKDELIEIVLEIIEECGVYWTFEDLVVLTPKPCSIRMEGVTLHADDGMALEYGNGDGLYAFNGEVKNSLMEVNIAKRVSDETSTKT